MRKLSKKIVVCFLFIVICVSAMALPVSAANGIILTSSADAAQPGKSITITVGLSLDNGVSGGQIEVTYDAGMLWFSKNSSTKTEGVTDTITVDEANSKITIIFAPEDFTAKQATQKLVFAVTNNSKPGSKSTVTATVTRAADGNFTELTPSQIFGSAAVSKQIEVANVPTPTPTPTPTKTPSWTPGATTPGQQTPIGTDEVDPSATPDGTPGEEETLEPSKTPEVIPTVTPEATQKATPTPTPEGQSLLIKTGALGFWMMVVLIVGIWIGIAVGYLIWGRKKGRAVRRSKIIGNDEF